MLFFYIYLILFYFFLPVIFCISSTLFLFIIYYLLFTIYYLLFFIFYIIIERSFIEFVYKNLEEQTALSHALEQIFMFIFFEMTE